MASTKNGIGYSPLTDKVYLGKQNSKEQIWVGDKKDITSDFLSTAMAYFEENTIRTIGSLTGTSNLVINIKDDKESIEKLIKNLQSRLTAKK
jgi:hypothetical protein